MLESITTSAVVLRVELHFPTLLLSQNKQATQCAFFSIKKLFPTNTMSETGTVLLTWKLSVRILFLVFGKSIAVHHCLILVALGLCVVSWWVINET